jgi:hypothetical protein
LVLRRDSARLFRTSSLGPQAPGNSRPRRPRAFDPTAKYFEEAMIVRSVLRCPASRRLQFCRPRLSQAKQCGFSTSATPAATGNGPLQASMLGTFTTELDRIAPRFEIQGSQIQILRSPSDFYETLKVGQRSCIHTARD